MNAAQISDKADDFGWHIEKDDINQAIDILEKLNLTEKAG